MQINEQAEHSALDLLRAVYRNPEVPLNTSIRCATAALPFEVPKLAVVATVNAGDFADQLEQAIKRSRRIEAKPIIEANANATANVPSDTKHVSHNGKPTQIDRRYRKW